MEKQYSFQEMADIGLMYILKTDINPGFQIYIYQMRKHFGRFHERLKETGSVTPVMRH